MTGYKTANYVTTPPFLACVKQFSSACLLHHAFEDGVVAAVARVRDLKVVTATSRSCCHAGTTEKVSLCYFCGKIMD